MKVLIDDQIQTYTPGQIARWMDELPEWRRRQALAYRHDVGRRQSLLAYRLLCRALSEAYGITEPPTFHYGEHGKPYLAPHQPSPAPHPSSPAIPPIAPPFFSLSHCREAVACAISDRPVGIDIETLGHKVSDSLILHTMSDEEVRDIQQASLAGGEQARQRTFLRLWTRKEAVVKLLGTGIRDDMRPVLQSGVYQIETRETGRYVVSTARLCE